MAQYNVTNGVTSTGKILNNDNMFVSNGGTANNTTINAGGSMVVSNGGTADKTSVNGNNTYYGVLIVSNGGSATNTTLNSRGGLYVSNGGTATNTTVNSWGHLEIYKGGTADKTTVNSGGFMYVYIGATATEIEAVDGAYLDFAVAPGTYIKGTSAGSAFEIKNGVANNFTLNHDTLDLHAGATANNTTVNEWGHLFVDYGGTATNTTVNGKNGSIVVYAGGTATNITVNADGNLTVSAGGTATEIKAVEGANLGFFVGPGTYAKGTSAGSAFEIKNGVANNFTVNSGFLTLTAGGTADNTTVNENGRLRVSAGGTATKTTVNAVGRLWVESGGSADKTTLNEKGYLYVSSGGKATNTTVNEDGYIFVSNGGSADKTTLNENGDLCVYSGGTATNTTVNDGGELWVKSGGTADKTTVNEGGGLIVLSGGTATGITAVEGAILAFHVGPDTYAKGTSAGSAFEIKNGVANNFTLKNGHLDLFSGCTATNTTVNEWGHLYVSSGGTVTNTTVISQGRLYVSSGGTATNTTVNENGYLYVYNGGRADNTTVDKKGCLIISSGGTATKTTVNSDGHFVVHQGGTATEVAVVDGAYLWFEVVPDTYVKGTSAGSAFEIKNGVANNFTFNHGDLDVSSGGKTTNTTVNSGGALWVSSGGTATKTTVNENGRLYVSFGGLAESATVKAGGSMWTYDGGKVNSVTVSSDGSIIVKENGVLTGRMTFSAGAFVSACEGGIIDFDLTHTSPTAAALVNDLSLVQGTPMYTLTVNGAQSNGAYKLAEGASGFGSKTEITVRNAVGTDIGALTLADKSNSFSYGGKKYTLQLNDESLFVTVVAESGSDNIFTGDVTGTQKDITSGMSALGVNVNALGILNVKPDGNAINTMVNQDGIFMAIKADKVKGLTVNKGGVAYIGSDTVAESFVLNGGEGHIESDGWAFGMSKGKTVGSNTIVKNGGMLFVSAGGHVEGLRASDGGHVIVEGGDINGARFFSATLDAMNGANISAVTLLDGGEMNVFAGGSAQSVHVSEGGILAVESGGELNHINVSSGGILTGVVCSASIVNVYGGTIDFDISGFTPDTAPAYLFEETTLESDEEFPCTLTVGDGQAYGTYGLLDDAYVFKGVITVQNTSGEALGTLAVGSTVNIDGVDYTVNISDYPGYHMTVTIADNEAPTITNIAADITAPTTSNVTVTAEFSDNVALASKQYRIGDGAWTDYTSGVLVTENATVYFKAVDTAGNETTDQYAVTNIDREKPEVLNVTPDNAEFTNQNVTVTADFTDNMEVASKQYRIGDGAWTDYTTGVVVTENTTVYFKATDTAGNESDEVSYDVVNIDKVPPTITITPSTTESGAESVTLSAVCKDETSMSSILQYRIGDGAWQDCTADVVVTENTTVSFKTYDTAGNETIKSYAVTNIKVIVPDTTPPEVPTMQASTNKPTNQDVIVTAEFTDDVGVVSRLYNLNNGEWKAYPDGGVVLTENATVYFQAIDAAGNKSEINGYKVSNIDKVPPTISVTPSTTEPAESVELIPKFADNVKLAARQYRIGSGDWQNYTDVAVKVTANTTVYFKATDTAGNETIENYVVSNIETVVPDTTKPVVSNVKANITAPTNKNVTVTAEFADDVALASSLYKIGDGAWTAYPAGGVVVTENATVYFKAVDTSDNESDEASITITNIDKVAPEKPVASANVTKPTNGSVNVTATFADDSVKNEYSMDGVNWAQYPGVVKFDDNGTVYFRGTDAVGNVSEVASYTVSNIDKVPPAKPTASADITTTTSDNVTVTAVFSGDSAKKEFSLDGLVWQAYTAPLVFSENGRAYFRGTDAAGNASDIISYDVRNIQPATPDNAPDDGKNNALYNKKAKEWASAENIASFVVNNITAGDSEVRLDKAGSVDDGKGRHNFVGRTGSDEDAADYAKIELSKGAALTFSVDSTIAGTFYVYQQTTDKKGNLVPAQRQKIAVKANTTSPKKTATIFLEAGEYFVGMEAKLPAAKKNPEVEAYYNVNLAGTTFFDEADSGWNNTAYLLDDAGKEVKTRLNPELTGTALAFGRGVASVKLDTGAIGQDGYDNWVGFSDATDYRMLTLENDANVTLSLTATGKTKLTIWKVTTNEKKGTINLSSKFSTTAKADKDGTIKAKFLEAGTYFVSVESMDAKKGGSAYYNVTVDFNASVFFDSADNSFNNVLYNKKGKAFYGEDETHHFETTTVNGAGIHVKLDSDPVGDTNYENFVGYQDAADYAKIELASDGNLSFDLKATGNATFVVYKKGQDKKGNDTLVAIQTTKLTVAKDKDIVETGTDLLTGLKAGEYYVSMTAKSTKANASGSVFYSVMATLDSSVSSALAMPETDTLGISDALSFGQYDTDALASASTSALADLNDKSGWQSLLA